MTTDTAHLAWNTRWASAEGRADWLVPEPDVIELADRLLATSDQHRVLDLGCGVGRHALHLARRGLETVAVDLAEAGLVELRRQAEAEDLTIAVHSAPMTAVPFPDRHFDGVVAFNVIYHGDLSVVRATLWEIRRVLKPGGLFQATMLSRRNHGCGVGTEIAPGTFIRDAVPADGEDADKVHPHFYCDAGELTALLEGFEPWSLRDVEHGRSGSWHWHLLAERRG